ncbi:MAG: response regulator [Gammaproteobacteria bacterium]|nr:response regulator [Gammaproteobacteria bacterium]
MNTKQQYPAIKRSPLAQRFIIYLILFSASITLITTVIQLYNEYQRDMNGIEAQYSQIKNIHLRSFTQSLWVTNYQELRVQMDGLVTLPNIIYASVYNGNELIAEAGDINSQDVIERHYSMQYKFLGESYVIGHLTVITTLDNVYAELRRNAITILINNALRTLLVVIFIYFIFHRLISRHISRISQHFQNLALDEYVPLVLDRRPSRTPDELDVLVSSANDMQERINNAHKALRESEEKLRFIYSQVPGIVYQFRVDIHGNKSLPYVSPAVEGYIGLTAEEVMADADKWFVLTHPDDYPGLEESIVKSMNDLSVWKWEGRFILQDGELVWLRGTSTPERMEDGSTLWNGIFIDITERVHADEVIRRTQKMDALGKLTGGIAHDYNNMLGVVLGYAELLKEKLGEQPGLQEYVKQITHAGERGAKLTKKLLTFSRNKSSDIKELDINVLLQDEQHMLEKTLTSRINLELDLEKDLWVVCLDESEFENALLNMSINAMHAIEGNGCLGIETSNEVINSADGERLNLDAGDYVRISVVDNGCGMDGATKEKIFDPFYSTKGEKGTGLGLSQVYGFVKRCGGTISVDSEMGKGSRFTLYFPRYQGEGYHQGSSELADDATLKGKETILVVDDEIALLNLTSEILEQQGYQVFRAECAKEALEIMASEHIDLLISDIIMPDMDGYALASRVRELYPDIKIQLASGFSGDEHLDQVDEKLSHNLLQKPYDSQTLLKRIRDLLYTS